MKRVSRLLFHNWPLKLAAVLLATMLYAGFVVSQSVQEFTAGVQIKPLNVPTTARLSDNLPEVTSIRYVAVGDASSRASADTFQATIDLADMDPQAGPTFVPVKVESRDARFTVVDFDPRVISVSLDPLKVRDGIRVNVIQGTTPEGLDILRRADHIYIEEIRAAGLYDDIWQAFAVLLPIRSVGVQGDFRSYDQVVALRAVTSRDGMTADWFPFPAEVLARVSDRIANEVDGVNRVVYDVSSKPPATIEWE